MSHRFKLHSNIKAFLESAVWTSFSLGLVDDTVSVGDTCIHLLVLNCSLEESFARLACEQSIVITRNLVTTDRTELLETILGIRLVAGANDTILHVGSCEDVARVRHDGGYVLGAG